VRHLLGVCASRVACCLKPQPLQAAHPLLTQNLAQHPELLKTVLFTAGERPNWTAQMAAMVLGQAAALEGIWVAALMHGNAGGWGLLDV